MARKFITKATIASFSSGFDSAIMMVAATSALSAITFFTVDEQRVVPVEKVQEHGGGDALVAVVEAVVFTTRYSKLAAFSSSWGKSPDLRRTGRCCRCCP